MELAVTEYVPQYLRMQQQSDASGFVFELGPSLLEGNQNANGGRALLLAWSSRGLWSDLWATELHFKHVQTGYKGSANKSGTSYRSSFRFKWRRKAPMPQPKQQNRTKTGVRGDWMCDVNGLLNLIETFSRFSISKHQAKREKNRILHLWILQA